MPRTTGQVTFVIAGLKREPLKPARVWNSVEQGLVLRWAILWAGQARIALSIYKEQACLAFVFGKGLLLKKARAGAWHPRVGNQ